MPLYEYRCHRCGKRFERILKFSDPPEADCPGCGIPAERLLSAPALQFKGTGWYVTDYARKDAPPAADSAASESKSETASAQPAETKKDAAASKKEPAKAKKETT